MSETSPVQITIIVPVYNVEQYLPDMIESVRNQQFASFEVILVDDGSTDLSCKICEKAVKEDNRFRLISQPNGGVSRARNVGLNNARGEYLLFIDADDCLLPNALDLLYDIATQSNADVVFGKTLKGEFPENIITVDNNVEEIVNIDDFLNNILYQKNFTNDIWGRLFKKSLFNNLRFTENIRFEDLDIFYKIYQRASKIVYVNSCVYFYRLHSESFIAKWSKNKFDVLDVTDRIEKHFLNTPIEAAAKDRKLSANFNIYVQLCRYEIKEPDVEKRCIDNIKKLRNRSLLNKNVRIKNKLGILVSFVGMNVVKFLAKHTKI